MSAQVHVNDNFTPLTRIQNTDSDDHKSHVAFPSGGPDSGTCDDPAFPVTLPRIFIEVYWASGDWASKWGEAMNATQPFVYVALLAASNW